MSANEKISLEQIEEMFAQVREQSPWDPSGDLTWGYYFVDPKAEKLDAAANELEKLGYTVLGILEPDDSDEAIQDAPEKDMFFLHVAKVETHSPETLLARNEELYAFATKHSLYGYDGMDVGPSDDLIEEEYELVPEDGEEE